ncbi:serine hydrolase domain-containing protein [Arenibacter troitsensis]|uniref:Beta-lactamase class C n=1 Tax=Arenibacter troitsensis TaxID=188872 RepID=A0A1X7J829_9FLAO|nr:serine hydrolase domain-containing protein [Arenibacter troitsensis]SMG23636.1 beta-lactamase class C [Arenibacter troitsensis]
MKRSKIWIGISLFVLTLIALVLNAFTSAPDTVSEVAFTSTDHLNDVLSAKEEWLYKRNREELKVAINGYFDKAISAGDIVGAGVSIVMGDSIVISDGFGKRNINRDERVDGGTIFRLGSLSKGFAGVLAAELKEEGKLHWEDKVHDFIPEFKLGDLDNTNKITLANILSHTAGTPYHSYTNLVEAGLPLQTIAERFKEITPISEPGSMYSYQNAMFALCGEMIQKATGQDISEVLTNTFFNPLGMCSTTMDYETLAHMENVAMPHSKRRNGWRTLPLSNNYYNAIAAGGISASSNDMAKWMRFLLGNNPELMSKSALAETFSPFIEIKGESKYYQHWPGHKTSYYGYGWRIHKFIEKDSDQEKTIWHHGGSVNNYRNEIAIYPEADLGICVLLSNNSRIAKTVIPDLYALVKDIFGITNPYHHQNSGNDLVQLHFE